MNWRCGPSQASNFDSNFRRTCAPVAIIPFKFLHTHLDMKGDPRLIVPEHHLKAHTYSKFFMSPSVAPSPSDQGCCHLGGPDCCQLPESLPAGCSPWPRCRIQKRCILRAGQRAIQLSPLPASRAPLSRRHLLLKDDALDWAAALPSCPELGCLTRSWPTCCDVTRSHPARTALSEVGDLLDTLLCADICSEEQACPC
jgi:hypothetical protein